MQKMVNPPSDQSSGNEKGSPSSNSLKAIYSCALYSFCSVSMVLVNKSLASR
jgi:hypothetical protein